MSAGPLFDYAMTRSGPLRIMDSVTMALLIHGVIQERQCELRRAATERLKFEIEVRKLIGNQ